MRQKQHVKTKGKEQEWPIYGTHATIGTPSFCVWHMANRVEGIVAGSRKQEAEQKMTRDHKEQKAECRSCRGRDSEWHTRRVWD